MFLWKGLIAAHKGGRDCWVCVCKYVSMWRESHKIFKIWALINQILPRCFRSYGLWLNKSNRRAKKVDISESTNINQSISLKQFYPIEALIFIQELFCFPIILQNSIFSTHVSRVCYSSNWKAWHLFLEHTETVNDNLTT